MLDQSKRNFKRELNTAMENVLDFRKIVKKYFLCKVAGEEDSDEELLYSEAGSGGLKGSRMRRYEQEGMGLLKVANPHFMSNLKNCFSELTTVRTRFKHTMNILMRILSNIESRSGDMRFLKEIYIRFNFNYYYHAEAQSSSQ